MNPKLIHVVFQQNDQLVLKDAFELDRALQGEILGIEDDWAVGPIQDCYSSEGQELRLAWWTQVLSGGDYDHLVQEGALGKDFSRVEALLETLRQEPETQLWIWVAPNPHDVAGYYWLVSQLRPFQGRVLVLHLNNLPFINPKGHIFYPQNLFEIPPREFLKAKKLARPVTPSEFEIDSEEWSRLGREQKQVRRYEGGKKLSQYGVDYFDRELTGFVTPEWQKASKIIGQFLSKSKQTTGDAFLLWRLKTLLAQAVLEGQGEMRRMKDFEIKTKAPLGQKIEESVGPYH